MKMLTSKQAASLLGVTPTRIQQLAIDGRLKGAEHFGRDWRIPEKGVLLYKRYRRLGRIKTGTL